MPLNVYAGNNNMIKRNGNVDKIFKNCENFSENKQKRGQFQNNSLSPKIKQGKALTISERQDLNLRPPPPQGGALPSCATSRFFLKQAA